MPWRGGALAYATRKKRGKKIGEREFWMVGGECDAGRRSKRLQAVGREGRIAVPFWKLDRGCMPLMQPKLG